MSIRTLTEADAEAYRHIRLQALRDHPDAFGACYEDAAAMPIDQLRARIAGNETDFILGAFDERSGLVGTVGFKRETGIKVRHKGFVWGMYVDPAYRRRGLGRELLSELLARAARQPGLERVNLAAADGNTGAAGLYESLGFEVYGKEIDAMKLGDGVYVSELLMAKRIG